MDLQHLRASDGTGEAVLAHVSSPRTIGSTVLELDNVDNWNAKCIVVTGTPAANGYIASAGMTIMYGHITAGDFIIDGYAPGYVDNGNNTTQIAIVKMTTNWADALVDILSIAHQDNGKLKNTALDDFFKPSEVLTTNFVASGGAIAQTVGLTGSFADIVYYLNGLRATKTAIANKVYTASRDTYVDIGTDGTIDYNEVANGANPPALAADHIRVAKVITSGSALTEAIMLNRKNSAPRFEAGANGATSLNNSAWTKMNLANEAFDIGSNYNPSTSQFTAPVNGYYSFSAVANATVNGGEPYIIGLYKNGVDWRSGNRIVQGAGSAIPIGLVVSVACTYLTAGEVIDVRVYNGSGGGKTTSASFNENNFSGVLLYPA